jgi:hypothetical protein
LVAGSYQATGVRYAAAGRFAGAFWAPRGSDFVAGSAHRALMFIGRFEPSWGGRVSVLW